MSVKVGVLALAACLALGATAQAAPARTARPIIDPQCFEAVAWEVDPAAEPIRVSGCRPPDQVPAPDAQGWVMFERPPVNGTDGGFIRARLIKQGARGSITFEVQDNGGGSGTFASRVTGTPDPTGVLARKGLKIIPLPSH